MLYEDLPFLPMESIKEKLLPPQQSLGNECYRWGN